MAVDDRISFYGISILADTPRLYGVSIKNDETRLQGISILASNFFGGNIQVVDSSGNAIEGATITITSTQTNPSNYIGDLSGTTDINGMFAASGSSTTGTTVNIEKTGYFSYSGPLTATDYGVGTTIVLAEASSGGASKKIYTTNKGNIMINPNDTILIEVN